MDNVTHSLTGLALARAGLNRVSCGAVLLLLLSANIPDIDITGLLRGQLCYLELHRGYTHSLLALPIMAGLCILLAAPFLRHKVLRLGRAYALCCVGVASHLLLDWTNSYGVRLWLPFSSRWLHLDLNGLYDDWILAVLAFAAVWPLFAKLVSSEIGERPASGRGTAIAALVFFVLFDGARFMFHARAVEQLNARLYEDAPAVQVAALPNSSNPLRWLGVVETARAYSLLELDVIAPLNVEAAHAFYKPQITAGLLKVKATPPFRYFSYFARFPVWSEQPAVLRTGTGRRYELTDLRFGTPGAGSFHCVALINEAGSVLNDRFTFGSGQDLGWP
ncbi:MAG: metal-dependent hydrolase [Acidobacteriaceae bacterium]|nr:metal-dependent hydrolase [Acidobacteriaceae bacterium]